jgi:hypothetical protein
VGYLRVAHDPAEMPELVLGVVDPNRYATFSARFLALAILCKSIIYSGDIAV